MKRLIRHAFFCLAAGSTILVLQSAPIPDEYIVQLKDGFDPAGISQAHGINAKHLYRHAINGFAARIPPGQLKKLQDDPSVANISPNHEVFAYRGKPGAGGGSTPTPSEQVIPEGLKRIGAVPAANTHPGSGVGVAILDTGLDFGHPDLNVSTTDSFYGYGESAQDENGHGTHVGGIVAAKNNTQDVVGVAAGATLYSVKVLDAGGSGADDVVIAGLNWVLNNADGANPPIRVINMSLGRPKVGGPADAVMEAAINAVIDAGVTVVVAAGNDARLEANHQIPAGLTRVICVASTTAKTGVSQSSRASAILADTASYFTSDGSNVTVSAPGEDQENISKSLFIQSVGILSLQLGGGVTRMSGTSMACPHVAGIVALLLEAEPGLEPEAIKTRLSTTADRDGTVPLASPTSSYSDDEVREGVAHAGRALKPGS